MRRTSAAGTIGVGFFDGPSTSSPQIDSEACPAEAIVGSTTGRTRKAGCLGHPDYDDVVVRQRRGDPGVVYVLGASATPGQLTVRTREEAVAQAIAFARQQRLRAWFDNGDGTFLLLGTFRKKELKPVRTS